MKNRLVMSIAALIAVAFSQSCNAQFEQPGTPPAASPSAAPMMTKAMGFRVGAIPSKRFHNHEQGADFESNGGVTPGIKVVKVENHGLAQSNGLEIGDIILSVNGSPISNEADLQRAFNSAVGSANLSIVNIRTGGTESMQYTMTSEAGSYQTNFGRIDLTQTPTGTPGVTLLEGTLHFHSGATSKIKGTLSGNSFRGTSSNATRQPASFVLTKSNNMFEGHITQGRKHRFVFVKLN